MTRNDHAGDWNWRNSRPPPLPAMLDLNNPKIYLHIWSSLTCNHLVKLIQAKRGLTRLARGPCNHSAPYISLQK